MIQFQENTRTEGLKDGLADPITYDHFGYRQGSKKRERDLMFPNLSHFAKFALKFSLTYKVLTDICKYQKIM